MTDKTVSTKVGVAFLMDDWIRLWVRIERSIATIWDLQKRYCLIGSSFGSMIVMAIHAKISGQTCPDK